MKAGLYPKINLLLTVLLPAVTLLLGQTSFFYIIYLFWWQELLATLLDAVYLRRWRRRTGESDFIPIGARLFLLFIYFVFIVVLFGFISDWHNRHLMRINLEVLFFRNHFFTLNLAGILINEWWIRRLQGLPRPGIRDPFSGRMLVLHITIIFGAMLHFMVVRRLPDFFGTGQAWGPVLVSLPFLMLKAWLDVRQQRAAAAQSERIH